MLGHTSRLKSATRVLGEEIAGYCERPGAGAAAEISELAPAAFAAEAARIAEGQEKR